MFVGLFQGCGVDFSGNAWKTDDRVPDTDRCGDCHTANNSSILQLIREGKQSFFSPRRNVPIEELHNAHIRSAGAVCADCHEMQKIELASHKDDDHNSNLIFPWTRGADGQLTCSSGTCHGSQPVVWTPAAQNKPGCFSCHAVFDPQFVHAGKNKSHASVQQLVEADKLSCQACHPRSVDSEGRAVAGHATDNMHADALESCDGACHKSPPESHPNYLPPLPTNILRDFFVRNTCETCHPVPENPLFVGGLHRNNENNFVIEEQPEQKETFCKTCHTGTEETHASDFVETLQYFAAQCFSCHPNDADHQTGPRPASGGSDHGDNATQVQCGNAACHDRERGEVGAIHQTHLQSQLLPEPIVCDACHQVPSTEEMREHLSDSWPSAQYFLNGTCQNIACHGADLNEAQQPQNLVWSEDQSRALGTCGDMCHTMPPGTSPHAIPVIRTDCNTCHPDPRTEGATEHIDGEVDLN